MLKNLIQTLCFLIHINYLYCHSTHSVHHEHEHEMPSYIKIFDSLFSNNFYKVAISILIISLPSLPAFFLLKLATKFFNKALNIMENLILDKLIAFSVGAIIGDIFLHMFPEFDELQHHKERDYSFIIIGILSFYIFNYVIERLSNNSHAHSHQQKKTHKNEKKELIQQSDKVQKQKAFIYLLGDFIHNFTDGIGIGTSYSMNSLLGITSTIAIGMHEIPHEFGDFAFLMKQNYSLFAIFKTQIITSIGAFLGGIVGLIMGNIFQTELLGFTIGTFLYLSMTIILPDILSKKSQGFLSFNFNLIFMCLGVYIMKLLCQFE